MSRPRYTNIAPSKARDRLFEPICGYLFLDQEEHRARVQAVDFALRVTALLVERGNIEHIIAQLSEELEKY